MLPYPKKYLSVILFFVVTPAVWGGPITRAATESVVVPTHGDCLNANSINTPYIYADFTIQSGATLSLCPGQSGEIYIRVQGSFIVESGGRIDLNYRGSGAGVPGWLLATGVDQESPPGLGTGDGPKTGHGGANTGGNGGQGGNPGSQGATGSHGGSGGHGGHGAADAATDDCAAPGGPGGGGGAGGSGGMPGGGIFIEATSITNNGTIDLNGAAGNIGANGGNGHNGHGCSAGSASAGGGGGGGPMAGGGGGGAHVSCGTFEDDTAAGGGGGGGGGRGAGGGGGGAGFIYARAKTIVNNGIINAIGGPGGPGGWGGPGGGGGHYTADCGEWAHGGHGGQAGGGGGDGGRGAHGAIVLIHGDDPGDLVVGSLGGGYGDSGNYTSISDLSEPIIEPLEVVSLTEGDEIVSGWINFKGLNRFYTESGSLLQLPRVRINNYDANTDPLYFGIKQVTFQIIPGCTPGSQASGSFFFYNSGLAVNGTNYHASAGYLLWPEVTNLTIQNSDFNTYALPDGVNCLSVTALTASNAAKVQGTPLLIDQFAPCDNASGHSCDYDFIYQNGEKTLGTNSNTVDIQLRLDDGKGSGIFSSGTNTNIKVIAVKQEASGFTSLNGYDVDLGNNGAANAGKACGGDNMWDWVDTNPSKNDVLTYKYNPVAGAFGVAGIELTPSVVGNDGTYWLFVCTKDIAGNWSYTGYDNHQATLGGESGAVSLCQMDPITGGDDTTKCISGVRPPRLRSRVFLDGPGLDPGSPPGCLNDPCQATVQAAYPGIGEFSNGSSVEITWQNPNDLSGIERIYYKLGNTPPSSLNDMVQLPRNQWKRDINANPLCVTSNDPNTECFDLAAFAGGTLYMVVQDAAGNVNPTNYTISQVNIDRLPPNPPTDFDSVVNVPTLDTSATFTWDAPSDNGPSGVKNIILCWNTKEAYEDPNLYELQEKLTGCGAGSRVHFIAPDKLDFTLPPNSITELGFYTVVTWARDVAGNNSIASNTFEFVRSDGLPYISFTGESEDYEEGGVSPRVSSSAKFNFRIKYQDILNKELLRSEIWIDEDGDGYENHERYNMQRELLEEENSELYTEGAVFFFRKQIDFNPKTEGLVKYRFHFESEIGVAVNAEPELDATADQVLKLDPYDLDFKGILQVRNGLQSSKKKKPPTALVKLSDGDKFKLSVVNIYGKTIKVLRQKKYRIENDRYVRWDLKNKNGTKVVPGIYMVVLQAKGKKVHRKVVVAY